MDNDLKIRPAVIDDIDIIYDIELESFERPFTLDNMKHEFRISFSDFLVAESAGEIIAFAVLWKVHDEIHLNRIAVRNNRRKQGIGRSIVDYIINKINTGYARIILIEVREKDAGAREFYRKLNFTETGTRKNYYIDDNAVLMEKVIDI